VNLRTELANRKNYGGSRNTSTIKYLVIHYTANDGDSDQNNATYFKTNYVEASAHYFVDSDSVTQSVPDNYVAWHCGANTYKHPVCRNNNSIGIELCDDRKNGVIYPTNETIKNALELVEYLMNKYSIPKENVIRHYDVTGKLCPEYWSGNTKNDALWKTEFWNKIGNKNATTTPQNDIIYRIQVGAFRNKSYAEDYLAKVKSAGFTNAFITTSK
jgi:N-acetylmuramoyl-L-alanine amidase